MTIVHKEPKIKVFDILRKETCCVASDVAFLVGEFNRLLDIKQRLLMVALKEGTILSRDDSEFVACLRSAEVEVGKIADPARKENARRILAHIRQFNPFNSSDVDENDLLTEVVEDFLNFSRSRIEKLSV